MFFGSAGTTFTSPGGKPASVQSSPMRRALIGVSSEGLSTTAFPIASAAATWIIGIAKGIEEGVTSATTPTAS